MFTYRKVAQMAAVFASKQGGAINVLKLSKLLYLADRESMSRYGVPISFDNLVSMDHGPVLSRTLNLINGYVGGSGAAQWDEWMNDRENHDVSVRKSFTRKDLNELSDADLAVIDSVWAQFGRMDQWALSDYTHKNCAEWIDPKGSSLGIEETTVFTALGRSGPEAKKLAQSIKVQRELDRVFSRL
jgi:uncharacterized phage-associated protein